MNKLINDMITEKNGDDIDPVRVCGLLAFVIYNFISIVEVFKSSADFNYVQYSTGMAIILGAISAGITFKYTKEKD